jgi:predicted transcriptional regulator YdeE
MKLIKQLFLEPLLKLIIRKNMVGQPEVIELEEKKCIGYMISTSLVGNQKKKDIPPFYHDIYDNDKLGVLREDNDQYMYCIYNLHENGKDFDYYVAVENKKGISADSYCEITLPKGKYVQVEFMKRNHTAAALMVVYIRKLWIGLNGYESRNSPTFMLYDERFHGNYQKFGCKDGNYLGDPIATLHFPLR